MEMEKDRMDTEHFIYEKECLKFPVKTAATVCLLKQSLFWYRALEKQWSHDFRQRYTVFLCLARDYNLCRLRNLFTSYQLHLTC